jgi:hypothetical protein
MDLCTTPASPSARVHARPTGRRCAGMHMMAIFRPAGYVTPVPAGRLHRPRASTAPTKGPACALRQPSPCSSPSRRWCRVHGQGSPSSNAPFRETEPLPPLGALQAATSSTLSDAVSRYATDRATLMRRYDLPYSAVRRDRIREFYDGWTARLGELDFNALDHESRIDHVLLRNEIAYQRGLLDREERIAGEMAPLLPFAEELVNLQASRRDLQPLDARAAANALARIAAQVDTARQGAEAGVAQAAGAAQRSAQRTPAGSNAAGGVTPIPATRIVAFRTAGAVNELRQTLQRWYRFYAGYDPLFTWWAAEPYQRADEALESYNRSLRERVVGIRPGEEDPIIGDPIGADGLRADLQYELIPYSAAELVSIAEREFEWCEAEMRRASNELGFGNDWLAAIEHVKMLHVEPGRQAELTRMLAEEAIEFVESRDLLTVPPLAREVWRMEMLSAQQQRVAPFFLGGEMVQVAFPTDEMSHEDKLMAMRGNNIHFSRAVVHHELIPGHHLQQFMTNRYNPTGAHSRRRSGPRVGRCTGRCCSGTWASRRQPRTGWACCSGGCTAPRASSSR